MPPLLDNLTSAVPFRHAWRWWHLRRITAPFVRSLGYPAASWLAERLASGIFDLRPPIRDVVERNLRLAGIARTDVEAQCTARDVFKQAAHFWMELIFVPRCFRPGNVLRRVEWAAPGRWEPLIQSNQPQIWVSPYLGNPVIGGLALCRRLGSLTIAVDGATRLLIDAVWPGALPGHALRWEPRLKIVTLPAESDRLAGVLEAGGRLCLLAGPRAGLTGLPASFLGRPCHFPATPLRLAARHDARLIVWSCTRSPQVHGAFQLGVHADLEASRRRLPDSFGELLRAMESAVRAYPSQYLWTR